MNKKKNKGERSAQMQAVSSGLQDVLGMNQWRQAHPKATLREIEEAVDVQMNQLRAQLIQEIVQMGEVREWSEAPQEERPRCERCGTVLVARGKQTRWLQTNGGEAVKLERSYGTCPECGQGIFPPG
jgi:ribosomal protein S27AE